MRETGDPSGLRWEKVEEARRAIQAGLYDSESVIDQMLPALAEELAGREDQVPDGE